MTRFSRLFLAGGQNAVPLSGWFLGGWSPGTTLTVFWFEAGMFLMMAFDRPEWFFSVFVALKAMIDVGSLLPQWEPRDPPALLVRVTSALQTARGKESFTDYWHRTRREEAQARVRDEEVVPEEAGIEDW